MTDNNMISFPIPEKVKKPWLKSRGDLPATLEYYGGTMYEMVRDAAKKYPKETD